MVSKGFPNVTTSGRQYNFGEKPSVILYTYINLHAGRCPYIVINISVQYNGGFLPDIILDHVTSLGNPFNTIKSLYYYSQCSHLNLLITQKV